MADLRRPGIAVLLAREQEEYDEYLVGRTANETPSYLVKLRAAQQAAQNAVSSTRDDLRLQYPIGSLCGLPWRSRFQSYYF